MMARRRAGRAPPKHKIGARAACRLINDQSGVTSIEYGLIALLIAIATVAAVQLLGSELSKMYSTIASSV
jgi:pilus assembly protein Flp/PilA